MSETKKYTPGEWAIRTEGTESGQGPQIYVEGGYYSDGSEFVIADFGVSEVRSRGKWKPYPEFEQIQANARLMLQSREMAEMLLMLLPKFATRSNQSEHEAIEALLRKAGVFE